MPSTSPQQRRLQEQIERRLNACDLWRGVTDARGYPRTKRDGRSVYAHRVAFESYWRPLDPGERVYRTCGERRCVNPRHLTTERPMPTGSSPRPPNNAKLTLRKARTIRRLWASADRPTQRELARRYRVSRSAISLVVRGITWRESSPVRAQQEITTGKRGLQWDPKTRTLIPSSLRQ